MASTSGWSRRAEFWKSLPLPSYLMFLLGVFFIFMPTGLLTDIVNNGFNPPLRLLESALLSGGLSVLYLVVANRPKWFPLLITGHILVVSQFDRLTPAPTAPLVGEALQSRLRVDTSIISISLIVSFILLSHFVRREGLRYVRAHTEISLDAIKTLIGERGTNPLEALQAAILEAVKRHGAQMDDQTILLIRALGPA